MNTLVCIFDLKINREHWVLIYGFLSAMTLWFLNNIQNTWNNQIYLVCQNCKSWNILRDQNCWTMRYTIWLPYNVHISRMWKFPVCSVTLLVFLNHTIARHFVADISEFTHLSEINLFHKCTITSYILRDCSSGMIYKVFSMLGNHNWQLFISCMELDLECSC
jgi:hypothetical protein